jgi:hypothetical protein
MRGGGVPPGFAVTLLLYMAAALSLGGPCASESAATEVRPLLIGSLTGGHDHWVTRQSFLIENMLEFYGIPYDYFDVGSDTLTQTVIDQYDGAILEGHAIRWCATPEEQTLIADNMENGNIIALVGVIHGEYTDLNSTVYSAMDVYARGLENSEISIRLEEGAVKIYDYWAEDGFVVIGGYETKHVSIAMRSLGDWSCMTRTKGTERATGFEIALGTWMQNAFGIDARVTLPVVSMDFCDTQATPIYPRTQDLVDFIDENKHRIRASGFLVTDMSAYQDTDSTLQNDEQVISQWGSMSLHGKDHCSVGADGENRDFVRQCSDMSQAVAFLQQHFPRYKGMKACPNDSWNEATLHAMYQNGIYYHSSTLRNDPDYRALYKSLFDVTDDFEREKMYLRGDAQSLRYYPFYHSDETGDVWLYSVDWCLALSAGYEAGVATNRLKDLGLDLWIPMLPGTHYHLPDSVAGATLNPYGWMAVMEEVMDLVDHDSYPWRRWVDTFDYAMNIQRFDRDVTVNSISVSGNTVTYDITTAQPVRFMTLRVSKPGYLVQSVSINGTEHRHFGDCYVHLPEIAGNATVSVILGTEASEHPYLRHIDPNAFVDEAASQGGRLCLNLSGEFDVVARVASSGSVFDAGTTEVFTDQTEHLKIDVSESGQASQVGLSLNPDKASVCAYIVSWEEGDPTYRSWAEWAQAPNVSVEHSVAGLEPLTAYAVAVGGTVVDTCISSDTGEMTFFRSVSCSHTTFEVCVDTLYGGVGTGIEPGRGIDLILEIYPNPTTRGLEIKYSHPAQGRVSVGVYSTSGTLVRTLVDRIEAPGLYSASWDRRNMHGERVAPGIYVCRLRTPACTRNHKIVVLR